MKKAILFFTVCLTTVLVQGCKSEKSDANTVPIGANAMTNENVRLSYAMGAMLGQNWRVLGVTNLNYDPFLQGVKDGFAGHKLLLTMPEMHKTLSQYREELDRKRAKEFQEMVKKNLKASQEYLAKNKKREGVVTLPDGLQYKVIAKGSGPLPTSNDTVAVSYEGTFIDGKEFDHSDKAQFNLAYIIRGLGEALTRMNVGSEWQLYIPPALAYGANGSRRAQIPPNSLLIFKLKLLAIDHPKPTANSQPAAKPKPVTSDIIKVPSAAEMKKGAKVEIINPSEVKKMEEPPTRSPSGK